MSDLNDKDIYKLWWEYLKRSEDYKSFCEWQKARRRDADTPLPKSLTKKIRGDLNKHPFTHIYAYFLDVHAETLKGKPYNFEIWWKKQQKVLKAIEENNTRPSVVDYSELIQKEMRACLTVLKHAKGREPTAEELIKQFSFQIKKAIPPKIYVQIDLTKDEIGPLVRGVNHFMVEEKKKPRFSFWEKLHEQPNWPKSKIRFLELKRFLLVYDYHSEGLPMEQIVLKVGTRAQKENYSDDAVISGFEEDLAKAVRIVKNVEQGSFPGYYGKYSA